MKNLTLEVVIVLGGITIVVTSLLLTPAWYILELWRFWPEINPLYLTLVGMVLALVTTFVGSIIVDLKKKKEKIS